MGGGQFRGFTLVEILGVVTLLALISTIVTIVVNKSLKESKETLYKSQLENIRSAASMWRTDNIERIPDGGYYTIILKKLIENNYIDENIENPKTKEPFDKNTVIRISMKDIKIGEEQLLTVVSSGDGLYASELDEDRFIYRGGNPNNYLILKENNLDTIYRIISYENDGTIKVIRNESIGSMPWDERSSEITGHRKNSENSYCDYLSNGTYSGCNAWGNQNNTYLDGSLLDTLSNSFYYKYYSNNIENTLNQNFTNGKVIKDSTLNTYLNGTWLTDNKISDYITEHLFDVGGIYYYNGYTGGDKGIEKERYEQGLNTWNGKIGLFNITEIVASSLSPSCTSIWSNYRYNPNNYTITQNAEGEEVNTANYTSGNWPCSLNNWLYRNVIEWSLTPYSNGRRYVWYINSAGYFNGNYAYNSFGVRPVFFLKSSIILSGSGTSLDPYKIVQF